MEETNLDDDKQLLENGINDSLIMQLCSVASLLFCNIN